MLLAPVSDGIRVGCSARCRADGAQCLIFGIAVRDLSISGVLDADDAALPDANYTAGAGIRVQKADTIRLDNVQVRRKEYGVYGNLDNILAPFLFVFLGTTCHPTCDGVR